MSKFTLQFLDYFFMVFHLIIIFLNVFGWVFKRTRKLQLVTLLATVFSWLILGYFYGWGYCFLTDWHFDVLRALDTPPSEASYIQYLFNRVLGLQIARTLADQLAIYGLLIGVIGALIMLYKKATTKK